MKSVTLLKYCFKRRLTNNYRETQKENKHKFLPSLVPFAFDNGTVQKNVEKNTDDSFVSVIPNVDYASFI